MPGETLEPHRAPAGRGGIPIRTILLTSALALLALSLAPAVPAAGDVGSAWDGCVQYAYVADYHWYWVCVNPKDPSCPVYTKEQHGVTVTRECVALGASTVAPEPHCIPTSGGLDYHSFLCVDAGDPKCPVYTLSSSDAGIRKDCVPP